MGDEGHDHWQRLGKRELGRHAFEERMPDQISKLLSNEDDENSVTGVISKIARMLRRDSSVEAAYLCNEHAVQIHKLRDEGAHFCGYRNMQMLCLALGLSGHQATGDFNLKRKLSVPQLQGMIEQAWDQGINTHARAQTGGIKGTRKHVGTSEAEALILSLGVPCTGNSFSGKDAWVRLLDFIEEYFTNSRPANIQPGSMHVTSQPPIFLQRPQHSVTVVGFVKLKSGKRRLLIFDPAWTPPTSITASGVEDGAKALSWKEGLAMRHYSKSERYLKRFNAFEIVTIGDH